MNLNLNLNPMNLNLEPDETHWVRHALVEAAANAKGTRAQEIYLRVIAKLSDPSSDYLGGPPTSGRMRNPDRPYLGGS